jgi:hypothetical protein
MAVRLPKDQPSAGQDLGIRVSLVINGHNLWQSLPDETIDLAAIPPRFKFIQGSSWYIYWGFWDGR